MCIPHAGIYGLFSNVDFLLGIALTHIHWYIAMFISESNLTVLALRMFSSGWLNIPSTPAQDFYTLTFTQWCYLTDSFKTNMILWYVYIYDDWFAKWRFDKSRSRDKVQEVALVHYWGFEELCEALVDTLCHLCLAKLHLFDQKYSNIVKYYSARAELSAHLIYCKSNLFWWCKAFFAHYTQCSVSHGPSEFINADLEL